VGVVLRPEVAFAFAVVLSLVAGCAGRNSEESPGVPSEMPVFAVDPKWPALPDDWTWGEALGVAVDADHHVWLTTNGRVGEFDANGRFLRSWDARGEKQQWSVIHGIFVDARGFVWLGARDEHQILKYTRDGELVLTIGRRGETGGSNAEHLLGRPSEMYVTPDTNEVFVADGYTNRRVVVYDATTGRYLRHWGAYGKPPADVARTRRADDDASAPAQFSVVHGITGSRDRLVYVGDRQNNRIQVFERNGTFVREQTIRPGSGAAFAVALSPDPEQHFLYVADGTEHKIWILRRANLQVLGAIGAEGSAPGEFGIPHNVATDGQGNLYVTEAIPGRAQKFTLQSAPSGS
jgi:DNA-binding beta-propeller fold protein YncE